MLRSNVRFHHLVGRSSLVLFFVFCFFLVLKDVGEDCAGLKHTHKVVERHPKCLSFLTLDKQIV